jgi:hypothetical protein
VKGVELNAFLHQYDRSRARIAGQAEAIAALSASEEALSKSGGTAFIRCGRKRSARGADALISEHQRELWEPAG